MSRRTFATALMVTILAAPAAGQRVVGTVTDTGDGQPLHAAFVTLADSVGVEVAATLTDSTGRYVLSAPSPGPHRVQVEMIGYRSHRSRLLRLHPDTAVRHDARLSVEAIALAGVAVSTGSSECRINPEEGAALHRLWREARKVLSVVAWAEREELLRYDIATYTRQLSPVSLRVLAEARDTLEGLTVGRPFRTLPVDDLDEHGYVQPVPDRSGQYTYFGPDADVVLSDRFVERHCFWVETDAPDGAPWIGLGFRPRERRTESDLAGVLWLDRESAELRVLEYRYTPLPRGVSGRRVGGRLEFRRLPTGEWIIDRWWIRTPGTPRGEYRLPAVEESGAVVLQVRTADESPRPPSRVGLITGAAYDRARPLSGALVYLSGTEFRTTTGPDGAFRLRVPAGRYTVMVHHPAFETPGSAPAPVDIRLEPGDSVAIRFDAGTR